MDRIINAGIGGFVAFLIIGLFVAILVEIVNYIKLKFGSGN